VSSPPDASPDRDEVREPDDEIEPDAEAPAASIDPTPADAPPSPTAREFQRGRSRMLLVSVLVVATCGLVYELISATMASYLLGDSVTQWSLVIGVYLSAMGLGSWLSKSIERREHERFVQIQLVIAIVGGFSATLLFLGFAYLATVRPLLFGILVIVGTAVGLEIPLMMRIMRGYALKDLVARVLAFDYLGSLAASLLFPLALLPYLGLVRTALAFGLINAAVAAWSASHFTPELRRPGWIKAQIGIVALLLGGGLVWGKQLEDFGESQLYDFPVIFSQRTPYQRLTITRWQDDIRLFINGNLQFSSSDEHRYHEALVHPVLAMAAQARPQVPADGRRVLVLGGGDGLALREILAHDDVGRVDLVDLDPAMTELFSTHPLLTSLNREAFDDPRVHVHNADAMEWLLAHREADGEPFDVAIVDLPDPNNFSLGKLYSRSFYRVLRGSLHPDGVGVVQSTSPYLAPRSFWCIVATLQAADVNPRPYHAHVPSFGDWGFVLISPQPRPAPLRLVPGPPRRFLSDELLATLFVFPADQRPPDDVEVNRLNDQMLVRYYEQDLEAPVGRTMAGTPGL
jgi:spermidine synthase